MATGSPIPPRVDRILYDKLAQDLRTFYETTGGRKNLKDVENRLAHLDGYFKGYRASNITPDMIAAYVAQRQGETTHLVAERLEDGSVCVCVSVGRLRSLVRRETSNRTPQPRARAAPGHVPPGRVDGRAAVAPRDFYLHSHDLFESFKDSCDRRSGHARLPDQTLGADDVAASHREPHQQLQGKAAGNQARKSPRMLNGC